MITPAILEKDYDKVLLYLEKYSTFTRKIQIDVCDGLYVSSKTWLPNAYEHINGYNIDLEFDLMVSDPRSLLKHLYDYDAKFIIIHVSCFSDLEYRKIYTEIKSHNKLIKVGIAIKYSDDLNRVYDNYLFFDYVQIMGIKEIGEQGKSFDKNVLNKIENIKAFLNKKNRESSNLFSNQKYIQIDGAMNPNNIKLCKAAGADSFAVGSFFKNSQSIKQDFKDLSTFY